MIICRRQKNCRSARNYENCRRWNRYVTRYVNQTHPTSRHEMDYVFGRSFDSPSDCEAVL